MSAHEVDEELSEVIYPSRSVIHPNSSGEEYFDVQAQRESEDNHQQQKKRTVRQKKRQRHAPERISAKTDF